MLLIIFFLFFNPAIGEPPQFMLMPSEVSILPTVFNTFGNRVANLIIVCNVTGTPTPRITWFMGDNQVNEYFVDGNTLFMNVTEKNMTTFDLEVRYHCIATNMIGPNSSIIAAVRSLDVFVRLQCKLVDY